MYKDSHPLPVIYVNSRENGITENAISSQINNTKTQTDKYNMPKRTDRWKFGISVFLCALTLFSFAICIVSNAQSVISTEKIVDYIASDFLGIDPTNDNRSFYEVLMSESFGSYGQGDNGDKGAGTPSDESGKSNQENAPPSNETEKNDGENDEQPEIPVGQFAIIKADLSSNGTEISNQTKYEIDINEYKSKENTNGGYNFSINDDMTVDPIVLIIHTHGTEAYSEEGSISYSDEINIPRSTDTKKNIVSVGAKMSEILNNNGIPTLHCQIMHDEKSYKNSYQKAAATIEEYLKKYPSIQYVFDVHRDSVISESKIKYKPLTNINEAPTAQIMLVMGSDTNSPQHTNWKSNLTLAIKLTEALNSKYNALTRPMSLRESSYNQEYTKGSLLLEIGSCGNTLTEAQNAAAIVAEELSAMIKSGW